MKMNTISSQGSLRQSSPFKLLSYILLTLALQACEPSVPDGLIRVKNDSGDSEYNVVEVLGGGAFYSLKPGEAHLLPRGTSSISFSRQYKNYTRRYQVSCPSDLTKGITIKLIDVHLNRMPGGCETTSASKN